MPASVWRPTISINPGNSCGLAGPPLASPEALFAIECNCGWKSKAHFTVEAAGRDADLHMAEKFPVGTLRRPCDAVCAV